MPRQALRGPSDRVVVIGAGLGGLSAALHLTGSGRSVRVLEAGDGPGGLMGRWSVGGYRFDTGPTVLTMPGLIEDALASVGESLPDWLTLDKLSPSYRACFADGSVIRSFSDSDRMAEEVAETCGRAAASSYRELLAYLTKLFQVEFEPFMNRNLDSLFDLVRPEALALLRLGGLRSLEAQVGRFLRDERLIRLFTFQALYAGVSPRRARALYGVISYLDSVAGVWFPRGGMYAVAEAMAGAATKHGAVFSYSSRAERIEIEDGRVRAVITTAGERVPADVVVVNTGLDEAYGSLLPQNLRPAGRSAGGRAGRSARRRYSPSAWVWHVGSSAPLPSPAHHTISFGRSWSRTFDEIINRGRLMSDPSLLITSPTVTDASVAPAGRHSYFVLAPAPNLQTGAVDWRSIGDRYRDEIQAVLSARGFDELGAFSTGVEVQRGVTPEDWQAFGCDAGTPFSLAHTLSQTGPLRHPTQHPAVPSLLFCGAAVQPGVGIPTVLLSGRLAASRVTG